VNEEALRAIERELGAACLLAHRVDVSKRDAMRAFASDVHERVRAVDVLVNNAGVGLAGGILDTSLDDWEWIVSINLWGVIHGCHFFVPKMVERGSGGRIVNVSSALGYFAARPTASASRSCALGSSRPASSRRRASPEETTPRRRARACRRSTRNETMGQRRSRGRSSAP
jgi:NAD(P)-dependent dehydrogenase (short-subunit alcohol dehydrogenase family)